MSETMIDLAFNREKHYSALELAEELGIKESTVSSWKRKGKIRPEAVVEYEGRTYFRHDVIDPQINADELNSSSVVLHEPVFEELVQHENIALLPEHFNRYKHLHERRKAGIEHPMKFAERSFGPLLNRKIPSPVNQIIQPLESTTNEETMSETYTSAELAEILGVSVQKIGSWKRHGTIPARAIAADGSLKKAAIDALVENGTLSAGEAEENPFKPVTPQPSLAKPAAAKRTPPDFDPIGRDDFVRNFWRKGDIGVEVLVLPAETASLIARFVNEALDYGYGELEATAATATQNFQ